MANPKRTDPSEPAPARWPDRFTHLLGVPPGALVGLAFFILVVVAVVYGWRTFGRTVVARPIYRLAVESIKVTPPPAWIKTDIRAEIVRDGALTDLTIFDKDATLRVYQAFELHGSPWISQVKRVSKQPPAQLTVDVEYRHPVAWVEVPGLKPGDEGGVIPVDATGYVLPTRDFTKAQLPEYLRISIRDVRPYGLAGSAWGDPRVAGAAQIARVLGDVWKPLEVFRILLASPADSSAAEPSYELELASGQRLLWGVAPGTTSVREPTAETKIERLVKLHETLKSWDRAPSEGIDLRNPDTFPSARTAAQYDSSPR